MYKSAYKPIRYQSRQTDTSHAGNFQRGRCCMSFIEFSTVVLNRTVFVVRKSYELRQPKISVCIHFKFNSETFKNSHSEAKANRLYSKIFHRIYTVTTFLLAVPEPRSFFLKNVAGDMTILPNPSWWAKA